MNFLKDLQVHKQKYYCEAVFNEALILKIYFIETPYVAVYRFAFNGNKLRFEFSINVSFTLKDFAVDGFLVEER